MNKSIKTHYLTGRFSHHDSGSPVLVVDGLDYHYGNAWTLENVSFELQAGERIAVVGPNGAGKSTLFKLIAGVIKPMTGWINVYGHEPGGHICIAYVAQRSLVDWNFPVSVADVVMMGRVGKVGLFRWPSSHDWQVVSDALKSVNLGHLSKRQINELSGGQQQRVFIARALAQEAKLILMDEPFTGLDVINQEELISVLDRLKEQRVTVLIAMHDLKLASERFDRVMLLNRKLLGVGNPETVFNPKNLAAAYGGHLRMIQTEDGIFVLEDTCCEEGGHQHA
jgi:ABC-type Mn2+/Zn2+ transport system ATPase subunit